jgi:hypothetical protein
MSQYSQTYNSFSGVDMLVTFAGTIVGELQGISYTVTREVAPLYTMGSADPRSFSKGKRGIAGSLVMLVFDRSALLDTLQNRCRYVGNSYEVLDSQDPLIIDDRQEPAISAAEDGTVGTFRQGVRGATRNGNVVTSDKVIAKPRYADQILPFDVVISAGNEFGHFASMVIGGVQIMNSGSGMSIDDITTDEAMTFVATHIKPWSNQYHIDIRSRQGSSPSPYYNNVFSGPSGTQS